jgi:hypothetical protein
VCEQYPCKRRSKQQGHDEKHGDSDHTPPTAREIKHFIVLFIRLLIIINDGFDTSSPSRGRVHILRLLLVIAATLTHTKGLQDNFDQIRHANGGQGRLGKKRET